MVFLWFSHEKTSIFHHFPMVFLWFSHEKNSIFLWFSNQNLHFPHKSTPGSMAPRRRKSLLLHAIHESMRHRHGETHGVLAKMVDVTWEGSYDPSKLDAESHGKMEVLMGKP
jgi:hypothetical protein